MSSISDMKTALFYEDTVYPNIRGMTYIKTVAKTLVIKIFFIADFLRDASCFLNFIKVKNVRVIAISNDAVTWDIISLSDATSTIGTHSIKEKNVAIIFNISAPLFLKHAPNVRPFILLIEKRAPLTNNRAVGVINATIFIANKISADDREWHEHKAEISSQENS